MILTLRGTTDICSERDIGKSTTHSPLVGYRQSRNTNRRPRDHISLARVLSNVVFDIDLECQFAAR